MATKKSTKAQSKTKTAAARTAAKKSATKQTSKLGALVKKPSSNKPPTFITLRRIMLASIVIYAGMAAAAVLLMQATHYDVTAPYQTTDPLVTGSPLRAAQRHFYTMDLRWLVASVAVVSIVPLVMYLTKSEAFYSRQVQKKQLWPRWVETALAGGLMLETVVLLSGWQGIVEIKFGWVLIALIAFFGYLQEKQLTTTNRRDNDYHVASALTKIAILGLLGFTALMTYIYGMVVNEWFVYALYAGLLLVFIMQKQLAKKADGMQALELEKKRLLMTLVTRAGFATLVVAGLLK